jgi:hypothetical protein
MNFKKYLKNIEKKFVEQKPTIKVKSDTKITEEKINHEEKKILGFVDSDKDPYDYLKRYIKETKYKDWFNRNYPNHTIYDAVGLSAADYVKMKRKLVPELKQTIDTEQSPKLNKPEHKQNINLKSDEGSKTSFNDFIDERELISHNAFGDKEMKIKILEISDEIGQTPWKFGDRVKINKILITIKHLKDQQIEESEFDIEAIENELTEKRHYTSTNRWVPTKEIKNGYLINSRHTSMISDAAALDYIIF